jgi:hypothetical protein
MTDERIEAFLLDVLRNEGENSGISSKCTNR